MLNFSLRGVLASSIFIRCNFSDANDRALMKNNKTPESFFSLNNSTHIKV